MVCVFGGGVVRLVDVDGRFDVGFVWEDVGFLWEDVVEWKEDTMVAVWLTVVRVLWVLVC